MKIQRNHNKNYKRQEIKKLEYESLFKSNNINKFLYAAMILFNMASTIDNPYKKIWILWGIRQSVALEILKCEECEKKKKKVKGIYKK